MGVAIGTLGLVVRGAVRASASANAGASVGAGIDASAGPAPK
jgi:hypothetical protein